MLWLPRVGQCYPFGFCVLDSYHNVDSIFLFYLCISPSSLCVPMCHFCEDLALCVFITLICCTRVLNGVVVTHRISRLIITCVGQSEYSKAMRVRIYMPVHIENRSTHLHDWTECVLDRSSGYVKEGLTPTWLPPLMPPMRFTSGSIMATACLKDGFSCQSNM